jgi:hypothetical protein
MHTWGPRLLVLLCAFPLGQAWADTPAEEGKRAFSAGVTLLQDPDGARYDEALAQFRRAYELTKSWKVLGNLGLCLMKLERDGEAITTYEKYIAEGKTDISADERQQIERDLNLIRAQTVRVRLEHDGSLVSIVDERTTARGTKVRNTYTSSGPSLELSMHAGEHLMVAKSSRGEESRWETTLSPAGSSTHKFTFGAPASDSSRSAAADKPATASSGGSSLMPIGFAVGGAGVVALGIGTVFALQRSSKLNERDGVCPAAVNCTDAEIAQNASLSDDARSAARIATIGFAAGGVLVATGVVLVVMGNQSPSARTGIYIAPTVSHADRGITLGGSF